MAHRLIHAPLPPPKPVRRGMSLVEMLVVMAIILVLVSLLFVVGRLAWRAVMALKTGLGH